MYVFFDLLMQVDREDGGKENEVDVRNGFDGLQRRGRTEARQGDQGFDGQWRLTWSREEGDKGMYRRKDKKTSADGLEESKGSCRWEGKQENRWQRGNRWVEEEWPAEILTAITERMWMKVKGSNERTSEVDKTSAKPSTYLKRPANKFFLQNSDFYAPQI